MKVKIRKWDANTKSFTHVTIDDVSMYTGLRDFNGQKIYEMAKKFMKEIF